MRKLCARFRLAKNRQDIRAEMGVHPLSEGLRHVRYALADMGLRQEESFDQGDNVLIKGNMFIASVLMEVR